LLFVLEKSSFSLVNFQFSVIYIFFDFLVVIWMFWRKISNLFRKVPTIMAYEKKTITNVGMLFWAGLMGGKFKPKGRWNRWTECIMKTCDTLSSAQYVRISSFDPMKKMAAGDFGFQIIIQVQRKWKKILKEGTKYFRISILRHCMPHTTNYEFCKSPWVDSLEKFRSTLESTMCSQGRPGHNFHARRYRPPMFWSSSNS
jgi:hypothetical protein